MSSVVVPIISSNYNDVKDNNQIKCLSYSNLPYYLEAINSTNEFNPNYLITSKEFGNQTQPAISSNNNSHFVAYNDEVAGEIMWGTIDGDKYCWLTDGGSYPSIKHWNDTIFYGTFVCSPQFYSGAAIPLCEIPNPENPNTHSLGIWNWESYGWYNITDSEIACDSSMEDWNFGYISFIGSTTFDGGHINAPHIFYPTGNNSGTISIGVQYDNCSHTDACIDHQTKYAYSIYDQNNGNHWQLVLRKDDFSNQMQFINDYVIGGNQNLTYPKISVQNDQMVIVAETDQNGNKDIICIYNTPNNPQQVLITNSDADERFPEIERIDDTTYICSFISNNSLYFSISPTGGQTWSNPIKIKENVIEAYKSIDLSENLNYMGSEVINGSDIDVEFDDLRQSIVFIDDDYNTSTPGWQYDHFNTIQDGVNAVDNYGTVYVYNGTYYETISINKKINLIGQDKINTIINGSYQRNNFMDSNIFLTGNGNTVTGFTIIDSHGLARGIEIRSNDNMIYDNIFYDNGEGIMVFDSQNNSIFNNSFLSQKNGAGLLLWHSDYNKVNNNLFINDGLRTLDSFHNNIYNNTVNAKQLCYLEDENDEIIIGDNGQIILVNCTNITIENQEISNTHTGISLHNTSYCIIKNNTIAFDSLVGIHLENCNNNSIHNNTLQHINGNCIQFYYSHYNDFYDNTILNDSGGLYYHFSTYNNIKRNDMIDCHATICFGNSAHHNVAFHNNFINTSGGLYSDMYNIWDDGYPSGGNYWSDYTGNDEFQGVDQNNPGSDGIGDIPYNITGNGGNKDNYPFIYPNGWLIETDVNQSIHDRGFPIRHALDGDWGAAQNFISNYNVFSHARVYLRKFGAPEFNLIVELRKDTIDGQLLDTLIFTPEEIPSIWSWLELDFNDYYIYPGNTLFIKCPPAPTGVTTSFGYEWGYAFGNQYDDGAFWFTRDGGNLWRDLPTMYEFVFKTFGYN